MKCDYCGSVRGIESVKDLPRAPSTEWDDRDKFDETWQQTIDKIRELRK